MASEEDAVTTSLAAASVIHIESTLCSGEIHPLVHNIEVFHSTQADDKERSGDCVRHSVAQVCASE